MFHTSQHQLAELIQSLGTGRMAPETALRLAATESTIQHFTMGANPHGKCAELVAMTVRNSLSDPASPWVVVNTPSVPANYVRTWLNPDTTSTRDLLYEVRISETRHIFVPGAQVKVGAPGYIARSLLSHARDPKYAKICDVDARLVCPDGTPRVAPDAFTRGQAEALRKAGFKFIGIEHLEEDAKRVHAGLKGICEHNRITHERELIIRANYAPRQVAFRAGCAGGIVFILVAGVAAYKQYSHYRNAVRNGRIKDDPATREEYTKQATRSVAKRAGIGGGIAAVAAVIESGVFHAAKVVTSSGTARMLAALPVCIAAAAIDVYHEHGLVRRGESSVGWAVFHGTLKLTADVLPLVLTGLGPAGTIVGIGFGIGLRWCSRYIRKLEAEIGEMLPAA